MEEETKEEIDEKSLNDILITILLFIFVTAIVFEAVIIGIAYFYSDRVECNWLWCTFTTQLKDDTYVTDSSKSVTYITTSSNSECYLNGEIINCSEIENYKQYGE
jgi:hypothetical protein